MAAWQKIADDKWFDPVTRDFTSDAPIEMGREAFATMGAEPRDMMAILPPLLGVETYHFDVLNTVMRVKTKDNNYG